MLLDPPPRVMKRKTKQNNKNNNKKKQKQKGPNYFYRMGGNICTQCKQQGINLQNLQTAHAAQYQTNKQKNSQKVGNRSK